MREKLNEGTNLIDYYVVTIMLLLLCCSHYDSRQLMQREIDDLRSRETLLNRKSEADAHSVKMLELRLKESEQVLTHRERELARREKVLEDKSRVSS